MTILTIGQSPAFKHGARLVYSKGWPVSIDWFVLLIVGRWIRGVGECFGVELVSVTRRRCAEVTVELRNFGFLGDSVMRSVCVDRCLVLRRKLATLSLVLPGASSMRGDVLTETEVLLDKLVILVLRLWSGCLRGTRASVQVAVDLRLGEELRLR